MHFALDDQITSQPTAIRRLLARTNFPTAMLHPERALILTGIGTSLHACQIAAYWLNKLSNGTLKVAVYNAHELALLMPLRAEDQVVVVSHRGTKRFPGEVLVRARRAGATTIAIVGEGAPEPDATIVIRTCPDERAGTHTVSYTAALTVLAKIVATLVVSGEELSEFVEALESVPEILEQTLALPAPIKLAERLVNREPLLLTGFGLDAVTAAEAALKLKEGTYQWAEGMAVELALHGPPAAFRANMGAITMTPAQDDGGRTQALRSLLEELSVEAVSCGDKDEDLLFAPIHPLLRPLIAIVPLQRLTAEIARLRGSNPDLIHRDVEPWDTAMGHIAL